MLKVMKTHEVMIKMATLLWEKCELRQIFAKWQQNVSVLILKVDPRKGENAFKSLEHISLVTSAVPKYPKVKFLFYLWPVGRWNNQVYVVNFFSQIGLKIKIMWLKIAVLQKFRKNEKFTKNCQSECVKNSGV